MARRTAAGSRGGTSRPLSPCTIRSRKAGISLAIGGTPWLIASRTARPKVSCQLGATRKVTDQGWLPRARQIGITGHSISPRLFVALGASGKFNHMVGVRNAGTILAVNPDRSAPVFDWCDVGIVADWREVVPELTAQLEAVVPA